MNLYPFQKEGVDWLAKRAKVILGDEMGLGKTVQIIGLINRCIGIEKVLVVCPASLKLNWERELGKWLNRNLSIEVLSGSPKRGYKIESDIVIINYDILTRWESKLLAVDWDFLVFDEAHYLKNAKALRSKIALKLKANREVYMSGTPMVNRPSELFNILNKIGLFDNRKAFDIKYCDARLVSKFGRRIWENKGASNLDELKQKLKPVMLRRLKKQVLTELPDKIHQIIELTDCKEVISGVVWYDGLPKHDSVTPEVRREAGEAKIKPSIKHIIDVLEEKDKLIVFAHHKTVIDGLSEGLEKFKPLTITGATATSKRQSIVDKFQKNPIHRVIICNIQAAGVGLTLTAADTVVFVELDWVPGNLKQAEDRAHRIGQKRNVLIQYLVAPGVDATIGTALATKVKNMEALGC